MWSCNSYTQLNARPGINNAAVTPAKIPGLSGIVDVAMGSSHAVALDGNGEVWTWGKNLNNVLGVLGLASGAEQLTPVKVPLPAGPPVVDIEVDYSDTTFATRADGTVLVWGDNNYGSAGVGNADYNVVGTRRSRSAAAGPSPWPDPCGTASIVRPADDPDFERPAQYVSASVADPTVGEATGGSAALTLRRPAPYDLVGNLPGR